MLLEVSVDFKMKVKLSKEQVFEGIGVNTGKITLQELLPAKEEIYNQLNFIIASFRSSLINRHKHVADAFLL